VRHTGVFNSVMRTLLIILSVLLTAFFVIIVAGTVYLESMLNLIQREPDGTLPTGNYSEPTDPNYTDPTETTGKPGETNPTGSTSSTGPTGSTDPTVPPETIDPGDIEWDPIEDPIVKKEHIINIMLIGQDRRPGESRTRSDAMILCTLNTKTKELTMTSIMRDTYVQIPGYQDNRINECYALGGIKLLSKCVETNFGVLVDGSFAVDFNGFQEVIDLVGGVDITLSSAEANYMKNRGYKVQTGMNHMDGETALAYARNRSIGNADFARTERQRKVISSVVEKCRGKNFLQMSNLLKKVLPYVTTDLDNGEILKYMMEMIPILKNMKIVSQRIPGDYFRFAEIRGMDVIVPDLDDCRKILQKAMK